MTHPPQLRALISRFVRRKRAAAQMLAITFLLAVVATPTLQAQTYTLLHSFTNQGQDGEGPMFGLAIDRAGNLYGITPFGGSRAGACAALGGCGTVFRLTRSNGGGWIFTPLYLFAGGTDGASPNASVTIGPDGAVYGTTSFGGGAGCNYGCGTIFKLTPPASTCHSTPCNWTETVLYRFSDDPNGLSDPLAAVTFDAAGNFYGTVALGGIGTCQCGAVYEMMRSGGGWSLSVLYSFMNLTDGEGPLAGVTLDRSGNLYGTTAFGGANSYGTVFELMRSGSGWTFNLLYTFQGGSDGGHPEAAPVFDESGNLYGDNQYGGANFGGVVFRLAPSGGTWSFSALPSPAGGLTTDLHLDSAGNIYGTTYSGGSRGDGSIFEISPTQDGWMESNIFSFSGPNGALPYSSVTIDASGNLYGTTTEGGSRGYGVAWQLSP